MSSNTTLERWRDHLRKLAKDRVQAEPKGASEAFLRWMSGDREAAAPEGVRLDDALWWALLDPSVDPFDHVGAGDDGSLFNQSTSQTIEVWTERELSGIHALWRIAQIRERPEAAVRARLAGEWHAQNTQPDNATNRPWGAAAFLIIAHEHEDHAARMYAETLVHNCQTTHGAPDALSGMILEDAAETLERYLSAPR